MGSQTAGSVSAHPPLAASCFPIFSQAIALQNTLCRMLHLSLAQCESEALQWAVLLLSAPGICLHGGLMAFSPQAQQETQKAALRYERAVSMHNAAREMVFVAEQGVMADKNRLDPTWQEMLNHATCKVSRAVPAGPLPRFPCFLCCLSHHLLTPLSSTAAFPQLNCFRQTCFLPCPVWPQCFLYPSPLEADCLALCLQVWH